MNHLIAFLAGSEDTMLESRKPQKSCVLSFHRTVNIDNVIADKVAVRLSVDSNTSETKPLSRR